MSPDCICPEEALLRLHLLDVLSRALVSQQPPWKSGVCLRGHFGYLWIAFDARVRPWALCCRWHIWVSGLVSEESGELPHHPGNLGSVDAALRNPLMLKNK